MESTQAVMNNPTAIWLQISHYSSISKSEIHWFIPIYSSSPLFLGFLLSFECICQILWFRILVWVYAHFYLGIKRKQGKSNEIQSNPSWIHSNWILMLTKASTTLSLDLGPHCIGSVVGQAPFLVQISQQFWTFLKI